MWDLQVRALSERFRVVLSATLALGGMTAIRLAVLGTSALLGPASGWGRPGRHRAGSRHRGGHRGFCFAFAVSGTDHQIPAALHAMPGRLG